jgi:hypothetical protein
MKNNFLKFILFVAIGYCSFGRLSAQELTSAQEMCLIVVSKIDVPQIQYVAEEPPKYWTNGILNQIGFSQVSLTNWAEGGAGTIAMNAYIDAHANYAKDNMIWENRMKLAYGFIQSFGEVENRQYKKSDDRWQIESKWGHRAVDKLYISAAFNFRTQFTPGFTYPAGADPKMVSSFLSPGYISLGLGIDYQPFKWLSLNLSPLTGNFVVVTKQELRVSYGNAEDQAVRTELGAQFKGVIKKSFKSFNVGTTISLFSDYLNNPQNLQVYWDVDLGFTINRFLTANLRTNLIYDDNIKIKGEDGFTVPRVQFKEIFSLSFTYTFGNYQKQK